MGFQGDTVVKNLPASEGDTSSTPGSEKSPGKGNGNPLQYSCLENSMDRGVWWATVPGVTKSWTRMGDMHNNAYFWVVYFEFFSKFFIIGKFLTLQLPEVVVATNKELRKNVKEKTGE